MGSDALRTPFPELGDVSQKVIQLMARTRRFGGEVTPVVRIDRTLQRNAPEYVDASFGEALQLRGIIRQQPYPRTAQRCSMRTATP